MRRTVAILSLTLAWLFANGAALDAMQVFAWARMVRDFTQAGLTFERAVTKALDGSAPCAICSAVDQARQEQKQTPAEVARGTEKIVLVCQAPAPLFFPAPPTDWPAAFVSTGLRRTDPVPVPPPRA